MSHSNTAPVKKHSLLPTQSSSLRCISAAEHHTTEQYSKTVSRKLVKHISRSTLSRKTRQDFLKIPSLWEAAQETEWRSFWNVILESNVTPNISRSWVSFMTLIYWVKIVRVKNRNRKGKNFALNCLSWKFTELFKWLQTKLFLKIWLLCVNFEKFTSINLPSSFLETYHREALSATRW